MDLKPIIDDICRSLPHFKAKHMGPRNVHWQVSYDPDLGFPTSLRIDLSAFIADEEISYQMSDVNFVDAPGLVLPSTSLKLRVGEGYQRVNDVRITYNIYINIYMYMNVCIHTDTRVDFRLYTWHAACLVSWWMIFLSHRFLDNQSLSSRSLLFLHRSWRSRCLMSRPHVAASRSARSSSTSLPPFVSVQLTVGEYRYSSTDKNCIYHVPNHEYD